MDSHGQRTSAPGSRQRRGWFMTRGTLRDAIATRRRSVTDRDALAVPRSIWQTVSTREKPPRLGKLCIESWRQRNPQFDHYVFDDADVTAFVAAHYNRTVLDAFHDLPLPVMRADVFRYMVLFWRGGVYADADTRCSVPILDWVPEAQGVPCTFFVGVEYDPHFAQTAMQWAFAAAPGHPLLAAVLQLVLHRVVNRQYNTSTIDFVHHTTGPGAFTEGLLAVLAPGLAVEDADLTGMLKARKHEWRSQGICVVTRLQLDARLRHLYSSTQSDFWTTGTWGSWFKDRDKLRAQAGLPADVLQ